MTSLFIKPAIPLSRPACLLATWFGSGLARKAPGTWGSLAALACGLPLLHYGGPLVLGLGAVAVFFIGCWATAGYLTGGSGGDPGEVVIDEVAGQWIALLPLAFSPAPFLSLIPAGLFAFACFRFFDILKPWPVGALDRGLKGALGVMVDDVAAGIYAAGVVLALQVIWERLVL